MRGRAPAWLVADRTPLATVAVLAAFGCARFLTTDRQVLVSIVQQPTIGAAYLDLVPSTLAGGLFVPLYAFGVANVQAGALAPQSLARMKSRRRAIARLTRLTVQWALVFAICTAVPSVTLLACAPVEPALDTGTVAAFLAVQIAYQSTFFAAVGAIMAMVGQLGGSPGLAMVAAFAYGMLDPLLSSLPASHQGALWMGWNSLAWASPEDPVMAAAGLARLVCVAAILWVIDLRVFRRADFLGAGGPRDASS